MTKDKKVHISCRQNIKKTDLFSNFVVFEKNTIISIKPMSKVKGAVVVNKERCKGCNLCVIACPNDVLELHPREVNNKGYHFVYMKNPDECIGCTSCGLVCPDGCLTIYRKNL